MAKDFAPAFQVVISTSRKQAELGDGWCVVKPARRSSSQAKARASERARRRPGNGRQAGERRSLLCNRSGLFTRMTAPSRPELPPASPLALWKAEGRVAVQATCLDSREWVGAPLRSPRGSLPRRVFAARRRRRLEADLHMGVGSAALPWRVGQA